ncbi:MAG TPA: pyridoxal phosphate-dependent aminotransferase [Segeticoccus sp.]|uniref:pyridoxal phosphate-dependent aminotransferase n=1 Tax=Segeticoccus sp. TaxID=2706531 RepID=UPI002D7E40A1|nr:pyridoxal phosphate-dependent aminotransferase [Segeticoccus sp.]HET8598791.1 pyridoxal phosphate-dependent aminotransferase [Segeticoccus sp.]
MIKHSATLAINEKIAARRQQGEQVVHLGFGEAGLPVLPSVTEALRRSAAENAYGPVVGTLPAREAAAGYFTRRGLPTDAGQVMFAPGSKALLYGVLASVPGDLVLPAPSWVTYAAQAALTGKRVVSVPIPAHAGGVPDPERLEPALEQARREGADPRILVLTLPDNPTGTSAGADLVKQVCEIADRHDLVVLSDEIYRDLVHDGADHLSPASLLPERTVVTSGLSKSMALGGWRIGFTRLPDGELGERLAENLIGVASEIWSSLAMPMQDAAAYVLQEPPEVVSHVAASRRLHATVSRAVFAAFREAGAACREPDAAFYLYPDLTHLRPVLEPRGIATGQDFADLLLDRHGVAVLAGGHFGDELTAYRFRVATSLLYGQTEQERWEALRSEDPVSLPWIAAALAQLRSALAALG